MLNEDLYPIDDQPIRTNHPKGLFVPARDSSDGRGLVASAGQAHHSTVLVALALLAFLFHSVLQLCGQQNLSLRAELGARRIFPNDIRALTRHFEN